MAEKIIVDFGSNTDAFVAGANKVQSTIGDIKGQLLNGLKGAMFAGFSIEALKSFRAEFKQIVDDLEAARKRTHANTDDLQVWQKQVEKIGGSLEDVSRLMDKLSIAKDKALENPSGEQSKAFAGLGIDRLTLLKTEVPDLFRRIQEQVANTGTGVGAMGNLMDLFGEKSVKSLSIFTDSFDKTKEQLKQVGGLIDSELISKYKEIERLSKENDLGSSLLGGKEGKGQTVSAMEEAWLRFKSGLQYFVGGSISQATDAVGLTHGKNAKIMESVENTQIRLARNGSESSIDNMFTSGVAGYLTPAQYEEIASKAADKSAQRVQQEKRIEQIRADNAEKAKTDEQKLNDIIKQRQTLQTQMNGLAGNKSKRTDYLATLEDFLRLEPKMYELQDKVTKARTTAQNKEDKENDKKDRETQQRENQLQSLRKHYGGDYQMNDNLVTTGNFIGTARSRMETIGDRHTELFEQMLSALVDIKNKKGNGYDFPDL